MKASISQVNSSVDPSGKNDLPVDYRDLEAPIDYASSAGLALVDWAERNLKTKETDAGGWQVYRLTTDQVKVMFYLIYAVQGHAREVSKLFHEASEVQS